MKKLSALLICALLVLSLFSCNFKDLAGSAFTYENADKYTSGDTEITDEVTAIDIDWISGSVDFVASEEAGISVKETSVTPSDNSPRLHWWLDGTVLRIKFAESGYINTLMGLNKKLTVTFPAEISFKSLDINTVSADISFKSVSADSLEVNSVSGKTTLIETAIKESVDISTVSGNINASLISDINKIDINSTSSEINVTVPNVNSFEAVCISSEVNVSVGEKLGNTEITTVSGKVTLNIPKDSSFELEFNSVSGDLSSGIALTSDNNKHTAGTAEYKYKINTTSADCVIKAN